MTAKRVNDESTAQAIRDIITSLGGDADSFEGRLVEDMVSTCLKVLVGDHDTGQMKLINSALKEMRYAYRVFNRYADKKKISIFGSARTPEEHPDYIAARVFGEKMARHDWMAITGAGDGIMKAGHEGPQREASFGLSIRLPFETSANTVIEGDPKLINFRYFFTRKLMFMTHAHAVAAFPGGFGTQDELFETLTLIQTGKSNIVPVVLIEGEGGVYWKHWENYVRHSLLASGMISEEDPGLFHIASDPDDAVDHVLRFYAMYHSMRYVGPTLVIRLNRTLSSDELATINDEFAILVKSGKMTMSGPLEGETDHLDMPRLVFEHHRHKYGTLRALLDRLNSFVDIAARDEVA